MLSNSTQTRAIQTYPFADAQAFSPEEITKMCDLFAQQSSMAATLASGSEDVSNPVRVSQVKWFFPIESTIWIFERLNSIIEYYNNLVWNYDLYGYDFFQYTEYFAAEGGKYDFHLDLRLPNEASEKVQLEFPRKLSLSLPLNQPGEDFEGGDFQILVGREPLTVPQKSGTAILFPSWLLHRVTPVTKGTRKSLVVWVTGPKFR